MAQWLRVLTALPEVLSLIPSNTWWLTTICNEICFPLLECLKTATVYLHIINKSSKKQYTANKQPKSNKMERNLKKSH